MKIFSDINNFGKGRSGLMQLPFPVFLQYKPYFLLLYE